MTGLEMMMKSLGVNPEMFNKVGEAVRQIAADIKLTRESQERMEIAQRAMNEKLNAVLRHPNEITTDSCVGRVEGNGRRNS
jgi:hypothetical protein